MILLVDHNLERHAEVLLGNIANQGWLDIISISFVTLREINLSVDSSDRTVWRTAQANQMVLYNGKSTYEG